MIISPTNYKALFKFCHKQILLLQYIRDYFNFDSRILRHLTAHSLGKNRFTFPFLQNNEHLNSDD